jgi:hypothetical protein
MLRLRRRLGPLQKSQKRLLHNVLRFAVTETQRPAVEDQFGRLRLVEILTPIVHDFIG